MSGDLALLRTDTGLFLDKGNRYFDIRHTDFQSGAKSDGSDATLAVQAALDFAASKNGWVYVPVGTFSVGLLTGAAGLRGIFGPGTLLQAAAGANILLLTSVDDFTARDVTFKGVGGSTAESSNNGIFATGCNRLRIENCRFLDLRFQSAWIESSDDVIYRDNFVSNIARGVLFRGCERVSCNSNNFQSPLTPDTTFTTCITLDSTDGHSDGVCKDVSITGNIVKNYVNAQAVLMHAGQRVAITGNVFEDCLTGVGATAFNSSDTMEDVSITGNVYIGTSTSGASAGGGNYGVFIGGGASVFTPSNITISGNSVRNANKINQGVTQAGITIGLCENVTVTGNSCIDCAASGISVTQVVTGLLISGNVIQDSVALSGETNGIRVNGAAVVGAIRGNFIENVVDGIRAAASSPDLIADDNHFTNVSGTEYKNCVSNDLVADGIILYTAADLTPSVRHNARYMSITNSQQRDLTDLDDGEEGQVITLYFADANTDITRDNAKLSGGAVFVSTADSTLVLVKVGSLWVEVTRTTDNS